MEDLPVAEPPESVNLDRAESLRLRWRGEPEVGFSLDDLRRACPCATCRGLRAQGRDVGPSTPDAVTAQGAELVGNWGLRITWSDGHDTGIYSWGMLHAWAQDTDGEA